MHMWVSGWDSGIWLTVSSSFIIQEGIAAEALAFFMTAQGNGIQFLLVCGHLNNFH